jgi:hypothetical protein
LTYRRRPQSDSIAGLLYSKEQMGRAPQLT